MLFHFQSINHQFSSPEFFASAHHTASFNNLASHTASFNNKQFYGMFGNAFVPAFCANLIFFFLLKLNMVCTFWIVLMCWCQKWFLKNKKKSLACISARKAIWKAPATTLPNTLLGWLIKSHFILYWAQNIAAVNDENKVGAWNQIVCVALVGL